MSQMLQLDALVMAMACLSTTQTDLGGGLMVPPSLENASSSSCPVSALSGLTTRMQSLTRDIASVKEQIGSLQEQLADLRRTGGPPVGALAASPHALGSRFLDLEPQLLAAGGAPSTPANCLKQQHGVVRIRPRANVEPFFVFCHQKVRGGGWTMVVNRYDGSEDFNRKWADYQIGFGPLTTEFFIGLDKLHQITSSDNYELLVQLQNRKQDLRYALYDHFSIGSESEQYRLNVLGKYQGEAADALRQHTGKKFSTQDRDNDESEQNCAALQSGAFWYGSSCNLSNPFGLYQRLLERDVDGFKGILWRGFLDGPKGSLKIVRMLVRPRAAS
ncbi:microfibril-associated glycoprotein 4 isoform X2 [Drosophila biarmipes]|uniref:microfibril-associated glycoprotein 4 isoform X2 n=1 Tax=Drosophila biarmipes TaxID=125945 RepID=UPI0007E5F63D|nr:microfibril-associated glycoprotein 4 isoform X2 [Drosophila biarmipes]